jgi:hypothetical protein
LLCGGGQIASDLFTLALTSGGIGVKQNFLPGRGLRDLKHRISSITVRTQRSPALWSSFAIVTAGV